MQLTDLRPPGTASGRPCYEWDSPTMTLRFHASRTAAHRISDGVTNCGQTVRIATLTDDEIQMIVTGRFAPEYRKSYCDTCLPFHLPDLIELAA